MESTVETLLRGQERAKELKKKIEDRMRNEGTSAEAERLAESVIRSFSSAISLLTNHQPFHFSSTSSHLPRRPSKRQVDEVQDSPFPNCLDGFLWRKYGQKSIKSSPHHHRSYYKCAYMKECNAKKQVQKIEDDPPLYRTTYFGQHTCHQHDQSPASLQVMSDSTLDEIDGSRMIHFGKLDQEINPVFTLTGPVKDHQEIFKGETRDDQMNQGCCYDQFFGDEIEMWLLDSPASTAGDRMIGSSTLDLSESDPFQFMF